jgi:nucleoside-diphosphate-sugar epimerase
MRDRAVLRGGKNDERLFVVAAGEPSDADSTDMDALTQALEPYQLVFDCRIASGEDLSRYPLKARNLAIAAVKTGAKVVHVSNYWSYLPVAYLPLDENHPREGGEDWVRRRREGEDSLLAAGAAVVHLPELYGPSMHGGVVQRALEEAHTAAMIHWAGPPSVEREYAFASDAMEAVVSLSLHPEAMGQRWIVGGNGMISANRIAEIVGDKLRRRVRVTPVSGLGLRLRALYDERSRDLARAPSCSDAISFNSQKLQARIGPLATSSHEQGIARTLEWLERRRLVK